MASPIFHRGTLVGFSGSIAHLPDIGGSGWACDTREVYEEGLRLMPVKFIENEEEVEVVADIIRANVRVPDQGHRRPLTPRWRRSGSAGKGCSSSSTTPVSRI